MIPSLLAEGEGNPSSLIFAVAISFVLRKSGAGSWLASGLSAGRKRILVAAFPEQEYFLDNSHKIDYTLTRLVCSNILVLRDLQIFN